MSQTPSDTREGIKQSHPLEGIRAERIAEIRQFSKPYRQVRNCVEDLRFLLSQLDLATARLKEAHRHVHYVQFVFKSYLEVGKDRIDIAKIHPAVDCALEALNPSEQIRSSAGKGASDG